MHPKTQKRTQHFLGDGNALLALVFTCSFNLIHNSSISCCSIDLIPFYSVSEAYSSGLGFAHFNTCQILSYFVLKFGKQKSMSGKASSSQHTVSFSGSGGLSHVYVQYPPLQCRIPGSRGLYYDDGSKLLLAPTSNQVIWLNN